MKFSDYVKQNNNKEKTEKTNQQESQKNVENLFEKYKNMSQSDLMKELISNVNLQKQNGTFDFDKLQSSINMILPYLSDEQKQTMFSLLSGLK